MMRSLIESSFLLLLTSLTMIPGQKTIASPTFLPVTPESSLTSSKVTPSCASSACSWSHDLFSSPTWTVWTLLLLTHPANMKINTKVINLTTNSLNLIYKERQYHQMNAKQCPLPPTVGSQAIVLFFNSASDVREGYHWYQRQAFTAPRA